MESNGFRPGWSRLARNDVTRRDILRGAMALGLVTGLPALLAACGGSGSSATDTPVPATPTPPSAPENTPTSATTGAANTPSAAGIINVTAREEGTAFLYDVDQLAVPAGTYQFAFNNAGTRSHDLMVYPVQDLTAMMTLRRQGEDAAEDEYIKDMAGVAEDIEAGKSDSFDATLTPGFYELACHIESKNPDGSTFEHFDKGQSVTIAVTGSGGPAASILDSGSTISVEMTGEEDGSWFFIPDRLVAPAGDVTFKVTNNMKMEHDFLVYPLGDITEFINKRLQDEEPDASTINGEMLFEDLPAGTSDEKVKNLTPGMWVAACFIVSQNPDGSSFIHRDRGQRFTFMVT